MSGIFNSFLFNNAVFNTGIGIVIQPVIKTGTGGIDPERKKRKTIYKPTGLIDRKPEGQLGVEQRVLESRDIHREIQGEIGQILDRTEVDFKPVQSMTPAEVDREIGFLMREKMLRIEEEEMMIVMAMISDD